MQESELTVRSFYEEWVASCGPNDYWIQVGRASRNFTVADDQINMIAKAIVSGMDLAPDDVLLDLCCGNGALTDMVIKHCRGGLGVDFSPSLIRVAKENFERPPNVLYELADVQEFIDTSDSPERFTKVACYGSFQTLLPAKAVGVLSSLRRRFPNVRRMFIGNLPDMDQVHRLFGGTPPLEELKRHDTPIGVWRTQGEIAEMAQQSGWRVEIARMPETFYASPYRFDAILTPA